MGFLSQAVARIKPSPTVQISALARDLSAAGRDIISLSAGEPDFDTPANVCAAAIEAIERGETRYTAPAGLPELRAAIARKFTADNRIDYPTDAIMVSTGAKQVIFNALIATLNPGDEVIVPAPYWVSYPDIVGFAGGTPVIAPSSSATDFKLTPEALEASLTERSKWLILNSPSNPTGSGYTAEELSRIADVVLRHPGLWVLSDDIYEHVVYPPFRFCTPAEVEPRLIDRCLTVNGVSKAYAMTGWRIGYCGGPGHLIRAMTTIQSQSTTAPCSISQWAAVEALTGPQDYIAKACATFEHRRDRVLDQLRAIEGLDCTEPQGAFYLFPSISGLIGRTTPRGARLADDTGFVEALLEAEGVAVVPGSAFGVAGHFRLSYAAADPLLDEACARIRRFCSALR